MRGLLLSAATVACAALPVGAVAQETGDMPPPQPEEFSNASSREVYVPADFARFAPKNALDMMNQVPGFSIVEQDQGRGLGQANSNVLINSQRVASNSETIFDILRRITAARVQRMESFIGATLGISDLPDHVANGNAPGGGVCGRLQYQ